jgi:hypothetical protein
MRGHIDILITIACLAVLAIILGGCGTPPRCPAPALYRDMGARTRPRCANDRRPHPPAALPALEAEGFLNHSRENAVGMFEMAALGVASGERPENVVRREAWP